MDGRGARNRGRFGRGTQRGPHRKLTRTDGRRRRRPQHRRSGRIEHRRRAVVSHARGRGGRLVERVFRVARGRFDMHHRAGFGVGPLCNRSWGRGASRRNRRCGGYDLRGGGRCWNGCHRGFHGRARHGKRRLRRRRDRGGGRRHLHELWFFCRMPIVRMHARVNRTERGGAKSHKDEERPKNHSRRRGIADATANRHVWPFASVAHSRGGADPGGVQVDRNGNGEGRAPFSAAAGTNRTACLRCRPAWVGFIVVHGHGRFRCERHATSLREGSPRVRVLCKVLDFHASAALDSRFRDNTRGRCRVRWLRAEKCDGNAQCGRDCHTPGPDPAPASAARRYGFAGFRSRRRLRCRARDRRDGRRGGPMRKRRAPRALATSRRLTAFSSAATSLDSGFALFL